MNRIRIAALLLALSSGAVLAYGTNSPLVEIYGQAASFNWKEFDGGDELLDESGPLFGVGVRLHPDPLRVSLALRAEGYAGDVDYDGETFGGEPVEDTTEYVGARGEVALAAPVWIASARDVSLQFLAGIGGEQWQRDLGTDDPETEYTEEWYTIDARIGAALCFLKDGLQQGRIQVSAVLPFAAENHVDVETGTGTEGLDLEPEGQPGLCVEGSWRWGRWIATLFYAYQKYDKSDEERVEIEAGPVVLPIDFFQPESERQLLGLNVGYLL